ncbi:GntR family transcriptional regulator [Kineosporia sp. J2-2]|uniref:GntR family transcriptional regulator n=1 Tax=Kineosporia corallincola TaxID=2835133 RepID=A0ABS5TLG1_9ACTN|nr:GntR family transcriptional regulator [Kineosporia corallincola]MBT0771683.1 GntR family transcriptional regulator [Kineosporia corallincola]
MTGRTTGVPAIRLDRASPVPLWSQLSRQIEQAVLAGDLAPGDRLDNEVSLARELGLSRPTVRQAIQVLVDQGLLVRRRGVGTQVVHGQVRRSLELTSLHDDLTRSGRRPGTRVLGLRQVPADPDVAAELRLEPGAPVWALERLRHVDGEPLAVMRNHVPAGVADLSTFDLEAEGLYASLRRAGVTPAVAHQRIGARRATAAEATLLGESRGAPLLTMRRTLLDNAGRPVELGSHGYRPGRYAFEATIVQR